VSKNNGTVKAPFFVLKKQDLPSVPKDYVGIHLFVLVHGFQGSSYDLRLLKNSISLVYPQSVFLCSSANEDDTEVCIKIMGSKLAEEVVNFINDTCPSQTLGRLSFISHSLGGLIVRAALPRLSDYAHLFYTYMTFSTPHLGYMYNPNRLVDAGMWFLKKWRKSQCLLQLSMSDAKYPRDSMLFKLSKMEGLSSFEHIVLFSSYQDQYAPFDSARIEVSPKSQEDTKHGTTYAEMARSVLSQINVEKITRFDVNFRIPEKTLDTFIGRAAHIHFLENMLLMRMLIHNYSIFFPLKRSGPIILLEWNWLIVVCGEIIFYTTFGVYVCWLSNSPVDASFR